MMLPAKGRGMFEIGMNLKDDDWTLEGVYLTDVRVTDYGPWINLEFSDDTLKRLVFLKGIKTFEDRGKFLTNVYITEDQIKDFREALMLAFKGRPIIYTGSMYLGQKFDFDVYEKN